MVCFPGRGGCRGACLLLHCTASSTSLRALAASSSGAGVLQGLVLLPGELLACSQSFVPTLRASCLPSRLPAAPSLRDASATASTPDAALPRPGIGRAAEHARHSPHRFARRLRALHAIPPGSMPSAHGPRSAYPCDCVTCLPSPLGPVTRNLPFCPPRRSNKGPPIAGRPPWDPQVLAAPSVNDAGLPLLVVGEPLVR